MYSNDIIELNYQTPLVARHNHLYPFQCVAKSVRNLAFSNVQNDDCSHSYKVQATPISSKATYSDTMATIICSLLTRIMSYSRAISLKIHVKVGPQMGPMYQGSRIRSI
jgi:hypothetical protein